MVHRVRTSDNEWYNEWQRVVQRVTTNDNSNNELQRVRAAIQRIKTAQYTSKNRWLSSFQWQKEIHYYFNGWMAAIRVVK